MTSAEVQEFLAAPRHAIVGTVRGDGGPQMSPVWYLYEDERFYIGVTRSTAKYRNLLRDNRVCICVDGGRDDVRAVMVYGTAEVVEKENPELERIIWQIIQHYIPDADEARAYADESADWDWALIVVTPDNIISQNFN